MKILPDGSIQYEDEFELNYELLVAIGFSVDENGYVYNDNSIVEMDGNRLKACISINKPVYAGQAEVLFEPLRNIQMMNYLFSFYIKEKMNEGYELYSYYQEEELRPAERPIEEDDMDKYTCLTIQHRPGKVTSTEYFRNKCLKFIQMIFIIEGDQVNLSNFDVLEDEEAKV